ncbi:anaerobic glycerol-3-phosphate dehydrogenase subunit C, partial [Candidatus Poribacteria bacterium]
RGYRIVFSAPSCLLAVREEYPELLGTPASKEVAENCLYIFELLAELKGRGELNLKFKPVDLNIAYHIPCHLRALGEDRTLEILREIPGLRIAVVTDKCCGMAGTFGMKKQYFELSMKAGRPLFEALENSGAELVATSCGTCRIQIEQATGMKTVHPIEILRSALI